MKQSSREYMLQNFKYIYVMNENKLFFFATETKEQAN